MKVVDLHSHTKYSHCGRDEPEMLILKMIDSGISVLGISDHNYGIAERELEYLQEIRHLQKKYSSQIKLFCGVEICTRPGLQPPCDKTFHEYDYCLIEDLYGENSVMNGDIIGYVKSFKCPVGIAHTDLFGLIEKWGIDTKKYLEQLASAQIFWELNVNYDSIHGYREHSYVKTFFEDYSQQKLIRDAGMYVSVGFDGHRMEDYLPQRVVSANEALKELGINNAIELIEKIPKENRRSIL